MKIPRPVSLFNTSIHPVRFTEVIHYIQSALKEKKQTILFPINIHILVELSKHPEIKERFERNAALVFCDGVPLVWLSRLLKKHLPERISGTDLVEYLLRMNSRIFLLGASTDVLRTMENTYKSVCGVYSPPFKNSWSRKEQARIIKRINVTHPDILLVGTGSLKQEQWVLEYFRFTHATIAIGVGSAFDILSGKNPRAPKGFRLAGLEWLWRTLQEPWRLLPRYLMDSLYVLTLLIKHYGIFRRTIAYKQ